MMRQFAVRIALLVLCLYGGASASTSAISNDALDDQSDSVKSRILAASNRMDAAPTPVQVTVPPPPSPPTPPAAERTPSANPLWAMPLAQLQVTRERPIFSPSRRPPAPAVAPVVAPKAIAVPKPREPERPQLSLVGTIAGDEEGFGIFLDQANKAVIRLRIGEEFQGWKLRSVEGRETALEKDRQVVRLVLPQPGLGQPSSEAPPVSPIIPPSIPRLRSSDTRPDRAGR
jgi:general secretion pathway protein N